LWKNPKFHFIFVQPFTLPQEETGFRGSPASITTPSTAPRACGPKGGRRQREGKKKKETKEKGEKKQEPKRSKLAEGQG